MREIEVVTDDLEILPPNISNDELCLASLRNWHVGKYIPPTLEIIIAQKAQELGNQVNSVCYLRTNLRVFCDRYVGIDRACQPNVNHAASLARHCSLAVPYSLRIIQPRRTLLNSPTLQCWRKQTVCRWSLIRSVWRRMFSLVLT